MKQTTFFPALASLLLLLLAPQSILAMPTPEVEADASSQQMGSAKSLTAIVNGQTVRCKTAALFALCTAENASATCDATGFHCNFMAACAKNCWCE
ncbi:hypothetical protein QBC42DRAFT_288048 [Cladorrhinum samala]|uniref:Uncharacterized protein n=1 Tax=Cladorrhinum samala TaxID=585594 RepID=A0AAV9HJK1_9PEZI|nr:hypothetical protein QBC42DRAFT_288048 [Cladorrhinum samala]